jgi:hypothetical protein
MDSKDRLELSKLIKEYDVEDTTQKIRQLKHSSQIKNDIMQMEMLKEKYSRLRKTNQSQFKTIVEKQCSFLYNNYTNIFNKAIKDELNLNILSQFLSILEKIENGTIDQHEGSFQVGKILKELYIDSAIKHENNFNKNDNKKNKEKKPAINISWNDYKKNVM